MMLAYLQIAKSYKKMFVLEFFSVRHRRIVFLW